MRNAGLGLTVLMQIGLTLAGLLLVGLLLAVPHPAQAMKWQVGAESVRLSTSKQEDFAPTDTTMPFVAIGADTMPAATFFEVGLLSYTVNGLDTVGAGAPPVKYDVTGTSLALVVAGHVQSALVLRAGLGAILYQYKPTITPAGQAAYAGQGITSPALRVDDTTGNFVLFGFDFYPSKRFLFGIEYRYLVVNPTFNFSGTQGGVPTATKQVQDDSQGWTALRVALEF